MKLSKIIVAAVLCCLCSCSGAQVKQYGVKVVKEYPHSRDAYTQGLFFHDGTLYETTGQYGESSIRTVDLETGKPIIVKRLNEKYFGEGSCIFGEDLYILTWTNRVAFRYNPDGLEYKKTVGYGREGWGLTTNGKSLIASDGSSNLFFLNANLTLEKKLQVTLNGRPLRNLNELEWIDGKIWANIYLTDTIVIIDPATGKVTATINCKGLLPEKERRRDTDVLNGIAVDAAGRIYLTGKNWPKLYQIELIKQQ
jgi:glutamine cyclotransferase